MQTQLSNMFRGKVELKLVTLSAGHMGNEWVNLIPARPLSDYAQNSGASFKEGFGG